MYLTQKAQWQKALPVDTYGDIKYAAEQIIACRKQPHVEEVTDSQGKVHISKHVFYIRANSGIKSPVS